MSPVLTVIVSIVGALALLALFTIWFCVHCAKKVLHPTSKRKPLDAWPDQYGLPYENVYFKTEDKVQLRGWFIPSAQYSNKTIILMHGWGMNRADILKNTYFLHDLGFNLFYFDFRALGESGGKTSSIGYLAIKDAAADPLFKGNASAVLRKNRPLRFINGRYGGYLRSRPQSRSGLCSGGSLLLFVPPRGVPLGVGA